MDFTWIKYLAESKSVALLMALTFNVVLIAAVGVMWRRYAALEKRTTDLLSKTVEELCRFLDKTP